MQQVYDNLMLCLLMYVRLSFPLSFLCNMQKKFLVILTKTNIDWDRWRGVKARKYHPIVRVKVIISLMPQVLAGGRGSMLTVRMRDMPCGKSLNCLTVFTRQLCWCMMKAKGSALLPCVCQLRICIMATHLTSDISDWDAGVL